MNRGYLVARPWESNERPIAQRVLLFLVPLICGVVGFLLVLDLTLCVEGGFDGFLGFVGATTGMGVFVVIAAGAVPDWREHDPEPSDNAGCDEEAQPHVFTGYDRLILIAALGGMCVVATMFGVIL